MVNATFLKINLVYYVILLLSNEKPAFREVELIDKLPTWGILLSSTDASNDSEV